MEALRQSGSGGTRSGGGRDDGHAGSRINLEAIMAQPDALDPRAVERALEPAEATLLRLLLTYPGHLAATVARMTEDPFVTTPARELWKALVVALGSDVGVGSGAGSGSGSGAGSDGAFDRSAFVAGLDPTLAGVARTLLARTDPLPGSSVETQQAIDQSLLTLERARLSERIEFTRARLAEAEAARDAAELDTLQQEVLELQQRRLALDRAVAGTSLLSRRRIHPKPTAENMEVAHGDGRH
jgi:hypothetical protein